MYLWTILQNSEEDLVSKVYRAQKLFPVKDDWIYTISDDLEALGIPYDEDQIRNTKQSTFKKLVNEKMKELSHGSLLQDKKGKLINLSDDYCMKEYLTTDKISLEQKQILFNLRTRMVTVRSNYKNKYKGNISVF